MSTELSLDEVAAAAEASRQDGAATPDHTPSRYAAVRPQDLARAERLTRLRYPKLELINERAAEKFARAVGGFGGLEARVKAKEVTSLSYGDLLKRLSVPANLTVLECAAFRGPALVVPGNDLLDTLVERLFGGSGKLGKKARQGGFSDTELRLSRRLLQAVCDAYAREWDFVPSMAFSIAAQQANPQLLNIAAPTDLVVICAFEVTVGPENQASEILFCFPFGSIEPLREQLAAPVVGGGATKVEPWGGRMESKIADASVQLVAELGTAELTLAEIACLEVGDVIALNRSSLIDATVSGHLLFRCRYGVANQQYAIEVQEVVGDPHQLETEQ